MAQGPSSSLAASNWSRRAESACRVGGSTKPMSSSISRQRSATPLVRRSSSWRSRQHFLNLRPLPQGHGSLRPAEAPSSGWWRSRSSRKSRVAAWRPSASRRMPSWFFPRRRATHGRGRVWRGVDGGPSRRPASWSRWVSNCSLSSTRRTPLSQPWRSTAMAEMSRFRPLAAPEPSSASPWRRAGRAAWRSKRVTIARMAWPPTAASAPRRRRAARPAGPQSTSASSTSASARRAAASRAGTAASLPSRASTLAATGATSSSSSRAVSSSSRSGRARSRAWNRSSPTGKVRSTTIGSIVVMRTSCGSGRLQSTPPGGRPRHLPPPPRLHLGRTQASASRLRRVMAGTASGGQQSAASRSLAPPLPRPTGGPRSPAPRSAPRVPPCTCGTATPSWWHRRHAGPSI